MEFKQSTFGEIIESEREMFLSGADQYGYFFINAMEFNVLLNDSVKSIDDVEKYYFLAFFSQVKKHHTLALFSAVRLHHIQAGMNLRQVLEAGAWAAYGLGNKEGNKFFEKDQNGVAISTDYLEKDRNSWLNDNFKQRSDEIKRLKKLINGSVAHSNFAYSLQNFKINPDINSGFNLQFFDFYDEYKIKTDLWFVANVALGLLSLFYQVNQKYKVFQFVDDFIPRYRKLVDQNNLLKQEMMNSEDYLKAESLLKNNSSGI